MQQDYENPPALAVKLVRGEIGIDALNPAKLSDREAFSAAIRQRPNLLSKLKGNNAQKFIRFAVTEKPENFIYLTREQYTDELAQIFLSARLKTDITNRQKKGEKRDPNADQVAIQRSADNKLVFCYAHTAADDEIYYFDADLRIPTSLRSKIKVVIKLNDALAFIDKIDSHITQLGENKIKSAISDVIVSEYRSYLNGYLSARNIGFYKLCASVADIEAGFADALSLRMSAYGIAVRQVSIEKISIPDDIRRKIEDQAFLIRQQREAAETETELAKKSLENYEAKLAIEQKYPDADHTLTEYEKDLALRRYLSKIGKTETETVDHSIDITKNAIRNDSEIQKQKDIIPDIPPQRSSFLGSFVACAIICLLISMIVFFAKNKGAGLIVLGVFTFIFGLVAAFNHKKFKAEKIEPSQTDEPSEAPSHMTENTSGQKSDKGGSEQ